MEEQSRGGHYFLVGYVVLVITAGLLSRSTLPLPDWFQECGGNTLWPMMMYGVFALLFPETGMRSLLIATLLLFYLIEHSQLLDYG